MTGFDSKRQAAQAKLDDDTQVYADTLLIVYQRGFADGKKAANAMHDLARLGQEIEQGQAESCVGKDPRCPCQDGDACHYKDCGNTKARPVAQPEQEQALKKLADLGQEIEQEPTCPECKAVVLYECVACSSNNYPPKPEQEPVAFINPPGPITQYSIPTQRQWVGLTDEEITEIYEMGLGVRASIETALDKLEERNT